MTPVLQHIQITQQQEDDHCCVFCTKALNYSPLPSLMHSTEICCLTFPLNNYIFLGVLFIITRPVPYSAV